MGSEQYRLSSVRDSAYARARIGLLGLWTGAMLAFGAIFVPSAFSNLPTQLAAAVLGSGFETLDGLGVLLGSSCVALGLIDLRRTGRRGPAEWLRVVLPLAGVFAHATSALWVSPALHALRVSAGGTIGQLPSGDPGLLAFGELHSLSRGLFGLATGSGGLALVWDVWRVVPKPLAGRSPDAGTS
jgi:hypothetical protein